MNEFKDQLDATEKEKVTKLISELRELAVKGQAADATITADAIREKINETQQASLGLFQKVSDYYIRQKPGAEPLSRCTRNATPRTRRRSNRRSQRKRRRKRRKIRLFLPSFSPDPFGSLCTHCRFSHSPSI
jgi:NH3-dependent NAD+ synthetase